MLYIKLDLPASTHINPLQAPIVKASCAAPQVHLGEAKLEADGRLSLPVAVDQLAAQQLDTTLTIELGIFFCDLENAGLCYIDNPTLSVPLHIGDGGATAEVEYKVKGT
jgi:hypothetical protein